MTSKGGGMVSEGRVKRGERAAMKDVGWRRRQIVMER